MSFLEKYRTNQLLKKIKRQRYGFPRRMYKYKELRKYLPDLLFLNKWENELYFDSENKADIEHQFARLMILRIHDFSEGVVTMIGCDCFHAIFPCMRALCESIFLLIHMNKHPEYIKKFMRKKGRGINVTDIKKEITDPELIKYYDYLSKMHHSNPMALKLTYYKVEEPEKGDVISFIPTDYLNRYEGFVISLKNLYFMGLYYIYLIMQKDWKKSKKISRD